jgi:protein ATS1
MPRQLYVFGSNGEGQLGIPAADVVDHPVKITKPPPLEQTKSINGGDNHTLLLTKGGDAFGVGDNRKGQLASAEQQSHLKVFEFIGGGISFAAATCESSAYIVNDYSTRRSLIHTEGSGQWGELGRRTLMKPNNEDATPIDALPSTTRDFSAGVWHYIAVLDDGTVYGWGKARLGQLGDEFDGQVTVPTRIDGIPFKSTRVVCGKDFTYVVGDSATGQHVVLGRDKFNIVSGMPSSVKGWKDIGATWHAIFVLFNDGNLIAWGRNTMWKLIPQDLPLIEKFAVGSEHVLALTREGKLISWGWGKHGNCGNLSKVLGKVESYMVNGFWNEIEIPGKIEAIGAGYCTSFVVSTDEGQA